MVKHYLASSNLDYVDYDASTEVLEVGFHSGAVYRYRKIPVDLYHDLMDPPESDDNPTQSHGVFFNTYIRNVPKYKFVRIK